MKNILKIFCIYILLGFASIIYLLLSKGTNLDNLMYIVLGNYVEQNIVQNFAFFFIKSIPFIITITFCAIRMSKKNEPFFVRLVPLYLILGLILNAMMTFINLEDANETFYEVIKHIYNFVSYSNFFLLPVCILSNLNPNNQIAKVLKIIGYVLVALSAASIIVLYIKMFFATKLPTVYSAEQFDFKTVGESLSNTIKIVIISVIGEISAIMLGFMSNYAFETETLESDVLNMDELIKQADKVAEERQKELYEHKEKEVVIDRSVSETTGRMNVDNQLGAHSNVGVVNKDEQTDSIIERALPSSSGPVINTTAINQAPAAPVMNPTPTPAPTPSVAQPTQMPTSNIAPAEQQQAKFIPPTPVVQQQAAPQINNNQQ